MDFRLTGEVGEKKAGKRENHENGSKEGFLAIFQPFFCPFAWRGRNPFFGHFPPDFGPKTRKQSVAGQRDRKVSVFFSSRQSDLRNFNKLHLHLGNFLELFFWGIDLITLTLTLLNVFELEM